jgi:hypothetical protein
MSKAKLIELTKELGVEIDYAGMDMNYAEISLSAPAGKHFGSTGHRASCLSGPATMTQVWATALKELRTYGLEPCDDECGCDA